jgi:beta-1,4-mannosyltransferase
MKNSIACAIFPNPYTNHQWMREMHPFLFEIANELKKSGCTIIDTPDFPSLFWVIKNRKKIDVLHIHWPEQYYDYAWDITSNNHPGWNWLLNKIKYNIVRYYSGLLWFMCFIQLLQWLKIPLVWTLHDIFPHTSQSPSKTQIGIRKYLFCKVNAMLLNCNGIAALVEKNLGKSNNIVVAPLGDYKKFYPDTIDRETARDFFNLEKDENMFLFFGTQRPHRNALELTKAFKSTIKEKASMWIIGNTPEPIRTEIESWGDQRIHLFLHQASNSQLEYAIKACDFVVMPGKNYLTSAVIALALSYGVPVIAPNYGCAQDMVKEAGILYDDSSVDGLINALHIAIRQKNTLKRHAMRQMPAWSWNFTAGQTLKAYHLAIGCYIKNGS